MSRIFDWSKIAVGLIFMGIMASVVGVVAYWLTFGSLGLSEDHGRWSEFGAFFGSIMTFTTALTSIAIAIFATIVLPRRLDEQREAMSSKSEINAFTRRYYDRDFYLGIMVPAWECASKWLGWEGPDGDRYRESVLGGRYGFAQDSFSTIEEANKVPFQNVISDRDHYRTLLSSSQLSVASEHMLLTMWWAFWEELAFAMSSGLVREEDAAARFKLQYSYWYDFHQQFWMTAKLKNHESLDEKPQKNAQSWEIRHALQYIESVFFSETERSENFEVNRKKSEQILRSMDEQNIVETGEGGSK